MDVLRRLVPAAIRRRFAVKFGIVLVVLGLSVGAVGIAATTEITDGVEQQVHDERATVAEHEVQQLEMWHDQNVRTTYSITWSDAIQTDDPEAIEGALANWESESSAYAISYVDIENEEILASTVDEFSGASADRLETVTNESYEQATSSPGYRTRTWVSEPYLSDAASSDERPVITYVLGPSNTDERVVVYTVELDSHVDRIEDDEQTTTMILDGNNEVMFDSAQYGEDYETFGLEYGDGSIVETARSGQTTTERVERELSSALGHDAYGFTDDDYIVSAASIPGTDWVVVTHEPTAEAYGFVSTVNEWGIYATILGVLMIGMVGAVLGRNTAVSIDRLTDKAGQMEEGNLDVDLETKRIDNIGRLYDGFDSMRNTVHKQIREAEAAREEAERERERVEEINGHLKEKAAEYCAVMGDAADGDLTARADVESDNEQMQQIGVDFNEMLDEIERTIAELNRFATDVATASEQVTASSEEVRSASQQVTGSIQEISDGADRQNESLKSVNQEMSGLSTTTEEIAASSNEVADIAERTVDTGQEGQEAAQEAIAAMEEVETEAGDAVAEIRRLEEEVQQIDELINTISEIARQTNMLALNANIEASRSASGSSDEEGFSVVAKEVKTLSEDVAEAADEAEDRLEAIRERTEQSAAEVEGTSTDIENASEQVQEAVQALEQIADLAKETNIGVQEISAATEEQAASTQEVVAMVDDAATISEETTSEAENVAAAAEEQTTALTEVTKSASNLSEQASQLSEALDRFDTDIDRDDMDLESMIDTDVELSPTETGSAADDADTIAGEQDQGITFDADADSTETADSPGIGDETPGPDADETATEPVTVGEDTDSQEIDAEEILEVDDETGAEPATTDDADLLADDSEAAKPLDGETKSVTESEPAADESPGFEIADEDDDSDADESSADPIEPVDDADGDSDDVFTFGATDDE